MDGHGYHKAPMLGTLLGVLALCFWSLSPVIITFLKNIPTLQVLSITASVCFIAVACKVTWKRQWKTMLVPIPIWIIGILGVYGTNLFYFAAFKFAPASHVVLINFTWPIITILLTSLLPNQNLTFKHVIASLIAFSGIFILLKGEAGFNDYNIHYLIGYSLALSCSVVWSIYCIVCKHYNNTPPEMVGLYLGVGALISIISHFLWEPSVMPSNGQWALMVFLGLTAAGPAYILWDKSMKLGNLRLLCVLSFMTPLVSIVLLILFGKAKYSTSLLLSAQFIVIGSLLASDLNFKPTKRRKYGPP